MGVQNWCPNPGKPLFLGPQKGGVQKIPLFLGPQKGGVQKIPLFLGPPKGGVKKYPPPFRGPIGLGLFGAFSFNFSISGRWGRPELQLELKKPKNQASKWEYRVFGPFFSVSGVG